MPSFDLDSDAAVVFTNKLEKLHRSALPVAVRSTLNSAAFDVKQRSMPREAKATFTERRKNFFKAKSSVKKAQGFDIKSMRSTVGFVGANGNPAVGNLEKQERGGKIGGRGFIPMNDARVSNSLSRSIRGKNRLSSIDNLKKIRSKKRFHQIVRKVGVGGFILYKNTVFEVKKLERSNIKLRGLYSHEKGRSAVIKTGTNFMKNASLKSGTRLEKFYAIEAKKQINRLTK